VSRIPAKDLVDTWNEDAKELISKTQWRGKQDLGNFRNDLSLWHARGFATLDCKKINMAPSVRVIVTCSVHRTVYDGTLIKVLILH